MCNCTSESAGIASDWIAAASPGSAAVLFRLAPRLNWPGPCRDQEQALSKGGNSLGTIFMKSVQPDNSDPMPLRSAPRSMGTLMIRFVGLLVVAVVALALIWSR